MFQFSNFCISSMELKIFLSSGGSQWLLNRLKLWPPTDILKGDSGLCRGFFFGTKSLQFQSFGLPWIRISVSAIKHDYSDFILAFISLSCGLENAPRKKSGVYVTFILFASFLSRTIALCWLLSKACKQLLYMFCLDFIFVYSKKLSPITATPSWMKLEHVQVILF